MRHLIYKILNLHFSKQYKTLIFIFKELSKTFTLSITCRSNLSKFIKIFTSIICLKLDLKIKLYKLTCLKK